MPRLLVLALFFATASSTYAQISVPSVSAPHTPIVATCETPSAGEAGSVQILWESDAQYIALDGGQTLHIWAPPGEHHLKASVFAVDWENRTFAVTQHRASFRVGGTEPTPVPPKPDPDPPTPKPSQVTAVIVHESNDSTPALSRLITGLRTGEAEQWLAAGGHSLLVLDDDATDANGQPLQIVASLNALGVAMPALFVLDGDQVLLKESLAADATGDQVLAKIKGVVQ